MAFRIYGNWARVIVNFLQSFQFFLTVVLIIVSNGQGLAQMAAGASGDGFLCCKYRRYGYNLLSEADFVGSYCCGGNLYATWMYSGTDPNTTTPLLVSEPSSLAKYCCYYYDASYPHINFGLEESLLISFDSMVVVHRYPPNYEASLNTFGTPPGPVVTSASWPEGTTFFDRLNGVMNCVAAYGGATLFNELLAEMRRPYVKYLRTYLAPVEANHFFLVGMTFGRGSPAPRSLFTPAT